MAVATPEDVSALQDKITLLESGLHEAAESMRIIRESMLRQGRVPPDQRLLIVWISALSAREERARKWLAGEQPEDLPLSEADKDTLRNYMREPPVR